MENHAHACVGMASIVINVVRVCKDHPQASLEAATQKMRVRSTQLLQGFDSLHGLLYIVALAKGAESEIAFSGRSEAGAGSSDDVGLA